MKKVIITAVVVILLVIGWNKLSNAKLDIGFLQGKTVALGRGNIIIPITATGEIQPKARSEIKPEASGEVVGIPVKPGQMVKKGDLIIALDPEDEQRNVARARNDLVRSQATLEKQRLQLQDRKTSTLDQINAKIAAAQAQLDDAEFKYDKTKKLYERDFGNADEMTTVKSHYDQLVAQLDGLKADKAQAEIAVDVAERDVTLAEKAVETAETNLKDAEKRLSETEIRAPIDGMISQINTEVGEVVQGGRTTITGGTILAVVADISEIYVRTEVSDADIGAVLWLAPPEARPGGRTLAERLEQSDVPLMVATNGVMDHLNAAGTPVNVNVDSFRTEDFTGVIERIYPEPKKLQNIVTYLVDIRVTSPNRLKLALVMGMQADVEFTAQSVTDVVLVPHDAIRRGPSGDLGVFIPEKPEGKDEVEPTFHACRFGLDNGNYAELVEGEGVKEGEKVYVELPIQLDRNKDENDEG